MTHERFTVADRPAESRYVLLDNGEEPGETTAPAAIVAGEESYVDVVADNATQRVLFHTGVDDAYAGQGLASVLVQAVIDDVIARGFAIVPVCPYVAKWLTKHPEYASHAVDPGPQHLRAIRAGQQ
ncbi:putative GNAT family acetyltransferase [Leucobacter exalbidus]|uniref:GNAT family acetyltransferase n=1 Tax=Leucobacter exalbidus TaxID=662960 RepID=A0A940PMY9_9MICO|nr:GNAT family N-acetyltransferase [Leucobacter exalbidus]MBP1326050.1 putative GNAT family acetyltransferase [Leucobacter exalbidus]